MNVVLTKHDIEETIKIYLALQGQRVVSGTQRVTNSLFGSPSVTYHVTTAPSKEKYKLLSSKDIEKAVKMAYLQGLKDGKKMNSDI